MTMEELDYLIIKFIEYFCEPSFKSMEKEHQRKMINCTIFIVFSHRFNKPDLFKIELEKQQTNSFKVIRDV